MNVKLTTPQDYATLARDFGAREVEVHEDKSRGLVRVKVSNLDAKTRLRLLKACRRNDPATVDVDVVPMDDQPTTESSERRSETTKMENVSTLFGDSESELRPTQERTDDPVEQAKTAYVEGDIGILELEDRLDDVLDPDPITVS